MSNREWKQLWPYRAVIAVDARDFSSLTSTQMQTANPDIQNLLKEALDGIGLSSPWQERAFGQHTGDGYVAGLEPRNLPALVGAFPFALHETLIRHQRAAQRPLQLRVSVHVGPLPASGLGTPMVQTHRLLDDNGLRRVLSRANPEVTTMAMIVSERVYEDVIDSGLETGGGGASWFSRHTVRVKSFERSAWVHVPGLDWNLADPDLLSPAPLAAHDSGGVNVSALPSAHQDTPSVVFHSNGENGVQGYHQAFHNVGPRLRSIGTVPPEGDDR